MKRSLSNLSSKLMKLHKDLIFFQAALIEKSEKRKFTPYDLFALSVNDDRFSWLRKFSELIIIIDTIVDDKEAKPFDLKAIVDQTNLLVSGEASDVSEIYKQALTAHPDITTKLADVKNALLELEPFLPSLHEAHVESEKKKFQH